MQAWYVTDGKDLATMRSILRNHYKGYGVPTVYMSGNRTVATESERYRVPANKWGNVPV